MTEVLDAFLTHLEGVRPFGGGSYKALCPAHDDRDPSLSVGPGDTQPVVLFCQVGCETDAILGALGKTWAELCTPKEKQAKPVVTAEYRYMDEHGALLFVKLRMMPKDFRVKRPDGRGGWEYRLGDTRRVLYRLPQVLAAIADGSTVYLVEGERDVHAAEKAGVTATCNFDGASKAEQRPKWKPEYGDSLKGAHVIIVADNDAAGRAHALAAYNDLKGKASSVRVVRGLVDAEHADLSDHLAAGHGLDDLVPLTPEQLESRPTNPRTGPNGQTNIPNTDSGISGMRFEEWDPPIPVDVRPLPAFPVECLGGLGKFVVAGSESLQVPPDLVAFAVLAAISTATGGRIRVRVKPDWTETTALYLAALADSSERKTPALNLAVRPIWELEATLIEDARPEVQKLAQEIRIAQNKMGKAEQRAASDKPGNAEKDADAQRAKLLELGEAPALPRLLIRDASLEAMGQVMHGQGGRIGLLASEGGLLKVAAGLYSGSSGKANTDLLLEAYSGSPYTVDRTGRPSAHMASTFMAIGLIVQPGVVAGVEKKNPEFRENGLLGRFLFSRPAQTTVDSFEAPDMPQAVLDAYDKRLRDLVNIVWTLGTTEIMRLSEEARKRFAAFYNEFAPRRMPGGDLHDIADWAGKLRGQLIRIAACLTLIENPQARLIDEATMQNALGMAEYFIAHARSVFDLMGRDGEGRLKPARDVLAWLRQREQPDGPFAARDAWQALKGRRWAHEMADMEQALEDLEEHGWITRIGEPETPGKRGRKPSPRYEVSPWIAGGGPL